MNKKIRKMKQKKPKSEIGPYLNQDFGDVLAKMKPLDLNLEFPSSTQAISLRLPREVLNKIRVLADEQDIPYQSLIKMWLVEKLDQAA